MIKMTIKGTVESYDSTRGIACVYVGNEKFVNVPVNKFVRYGEEIAVNEDAIDWTENGENDILEDEKPTIDFDEFE